MILTAPAKVNLFLKVLSRRSDGYHDIETVFERVSILDEVEIVKGEGFSEITCDDPSVPTGEGSLMARAVDLFKKETGEKGHFRISVRKRIPIAAGMGGGSSDTAAILEGLNRMSLCSVSRERLMALGGVLGADIPFFLSGASFAVGTGKGDLIKPLNYNCRLWHVMVNPPFGVSTQGVYSSLPAFGLTKGGAVDKMFSAFLSNNDTAGISENLRNDLQIIVLRDFPVLEQVFSSLRGAGARGVLLSGSGPTVFGLFETEKIARERENKVREAFKPEDGWKVFAASTF